MLSRHSHTLVQVLVVSTLALILSGAMQLGLPAGEPHRGLSGLVALLVGLVLVSVWSDSRAWLRRVALAELALVVLLGGLGSVAAVPVWGPWATVLHAGLSHVFFAGTMAMWLGTGAPAVNLEPLRDTGSPSLRTLSRVAPAAVLLQILLGALYRHLSLPVWPHLVGSLLVGCLLLYTGMVVLEADAQHPVLRRAAMVLIGVTVAQMAFGLGAFLGRVMAGDNLSPEWWMTASRTVHVVTGSLTLGAAVAYAIQVFYHVLPGTGEHQMDVENHRKSVVA